jgi:ATP-dependent Clp protease ATP-binding subunit ClpA
MTFTKNAIDALNAASSCARQLGHDHIGAEHIFFSVLAIPKCQACQRLKRIGLSVEDLTESMRTMIAGNGGAVMQRGQLPLTARTKKVLDIACIEAGGPGKPINTVHLVTAMMREGENAAAQLLFNAGVNVEKFLAAGTQGGGNAEEKAEEPSDDAPEGEWAFDYATFHVGAEDLVYRQGEFEHDGSSATLAPLPDQTFVTVTFLFSSS